MAKARHREPSHTTLREYALEWVDRYQGGKRGLRDAGRAEYRRVLEQYALKFFPSELRLNEIRPKHVAQYVGWQCEPRADGSRLSDKSVRNYVGPLSACLESARLEGEIDSNPARGVPLPRRPTIESEDAGQIRVLTREQLSTFLQIVHPRHRLFFELLASTGLRVSEAIALEWPPRTRRRRTPREGSPGRRAGHARASDDAPQQTRCADLAGACGWSARPPERHGVAGG